MRDARIDVETSFITPMFNFSYALFCLDRIVDGLGRDPAIFDDERVGTVAHTGVFSFGCPFQKCHAPLYQAIRVQVRGIREFLFEQPRKFLCAFTASLRTRAELPGV